MDQRPEEFITKDFLQAGERSLREDGFISDEHDFAPYREIMSKHLAEINDAFRNEGHAFDLASGYINHPQAGYAYFIYDCTRFSKQEADNALTLWLDRKYEVAD